MVSPKSAAPRKSSSRSASDSRSPTCDALRSLGFFGGRPIRFGSLFFADDVTPLLAVLFDGLGLELFFAAMPLGA